MQWLLADTMPGNAALKDQLSKKLRPASRTWQGIGEVHDPFHDRDITVTSCGRICMHRKRINPSVVQAGQKRGIKDVDEGSWLISVMRDDLGNIDLEQKTLHPPTIPSAQDCHPCLRYTP